MECGWQGESDVGCLTSGGNPVELSIPKRVKQPSQWGGEVKNEYRELLNSIDRREPQRRYDERVVSGWQKKEEEGETVIINMWLCDEFGGNRQTVQHLDIGHWYVLVGHITPLVLA